MLNSENNKKRFKFYCLSGFELFLENISLQVWRAKSKKNKGKLLKLAPISSKE